MKIKNIKKELALLLSCLYLFVALFSQTFHKHLEISLGDSVKEMFSKNQDAKIGSDKTSCLSCHFLHTHFSDVPEDFSFKFLSTLIYEREISAYESRFAEVVPTTFYLRGPPSIII